MTRAVKKKRTAMNTYKPKNLLSMGLITIIVVMMVAVISVSCGRLREKKASLEKEEAYYLEQIAAQEKRAEEIEEYAKYKQTKQYVEDMAKERLGLVYKDEIIFEAEN